LAGYQSLTILSTYFQIQNESFAVMKKRIKDIGTEDLIKRTARTIFFAEGNFHATTQDIAQAAGINRALIHYYFRSRENLFQVVMNEAIEILGNKLQQVFTTDLPFREKIEQFLNLFIDANLEYPYVEAFIISEINRTPNYQFALTTKETERKMRHNLKQELDKEIAEGRITAMTSDHFIVCLMSLCSYPLLAKPIIKKVAKIDEDEYRKFMMQQKKVILHLLFGA